MELPEPEAVQGLTPVGENSHWMIVVGGTPTAVKIFVLAPQNDCWAAFEIDCEYETEEILKAIARVKNIFIQ